MLDAITRSLLTFSVSLLWLFLKPEWNTWNSLLSCKKSLSCLATILSCISTGRVGDVAYNKTGHVQNCFFFFLRRWRTGAHIEFGRVAPRLSHRRQALAGRVEDGGPEDGRWKQTPWLGTLSTLELFREVEKLAPSSTLPRKLQTECTISSSTAQHDTSSEETLKALWALCQGGMKHNAWWTDNML